MTVEPEPISAAARQALEQELETLRAERGTVAGTLRDTDSEGDRADQADELQRADQVARLDQRIDEITLRLNQAQLAGPPSTEAIGVGSTVTLRFADGSTDTVHIGGIADDQDHDLVTDDSPLGLALLGHRAGDTVRYATPRGRTSASVVSVGAPGPTP
ncbi:nucleoside diphosphate kinase regulator [Streptacidiphilus sp. 4-A2]|nr:nucleoside diphosphate kinase regulator [Streptacidiphilus sp. 4-A2]